MLKLPSRSTIDLALLPRQSLGPFCLGGSREDIRAAAERLAWPLSSERENLDYFALNSIQVEYENGVAAFIGVANEPTLFTLIYRNNNLFDLASDRVFDLFSEIDGAVTDYDSCGHTFHNLIVTLWEADEQYDHVRRMNGEPLRPVWGQIGIGAPEYLSAIARFR